MTDDARLGRPVPDWTPPPRPDGLSLSGRFAALEPLSAERHAAALFDVFAGADAVWDYMPVGPFPSAAGFHRWMAEAVTGNDPSFFAIRNLETDRWEGFCSLLRIAPEAGSIEVGFIAYSPALQRTRAATEVQVLLMQWAFEAGYRRYEWKCNALNMPSRRAAQRLGFSYEGVFRQAQVVKGRNRDTAWFAVIDSDWLALKEAFRVWLSPQNFDAEGQQRERLGDLTALVRVASDPELVPAS
ncbi:GNAT family N-acetyltransferase [Maritimibacter sp. DP1N21-5]|uniref:GNAT family N-acetyltransferase n=1 Tax=Maritimibacter sp. DP1N21-5 TaxID=2836867 RepID=UPI001C487610|nr:GNAT family protein [Maritimibacter sp. DP1N21-5]MBV7408042.1 GNAT family N-acetyltransferase [Maritimibacter sp. DP1N21-5]